MLEQVLLPHDSPMVFFLDSSFLKNIRELISKNRFPQDAIQTAMFDKAINDFPLKEEVVRTTLSLGKAEYWDIFLGYCQALGAINIALYAKVNGELKAKTYVEALKDKSASSYSYLIDKVSALKRVVELDRFCALLFDFVLENPPKSNDYVVMGIKLAKLEFANYAFVIFQEMIKGYGQEKTSKIWDGLE